MTFLGAHPLQALFALGIVALAIVYLIRRFRPPRASSARPQVAPRLQAALDKAQKNKPAKGGSP